MYDTCHAWHFLILGDLGLVKEMPSEISEKNTPYNHDRFIFSAGMLKPTFSVLVRLLFRQDHHLYTTSHWPESLCRFRFSLLALFFCLSSYTPRTLERNSWFRPFQDTWWSIFWQPQWTECYIFELIGGEWFLLPDITEYTFQVLRLYVCGSNAQKNPCRLLSKQ